MEHQQQQQNNNTGISTRTDTDNHDPKTATTAINAPVVQVCMHTPFATDSSTTTCDVRLCFLIGVLLGSDNQNANQ